MALAHGVDLLLGSTGRRRWDAACGFAALAVPLFVVIVRVDGHAAWAKDLPLVRSVGFIPVGAEAVLSTLTAQVLSLLPLGGRTLRASLAGALWTALAARLLYGLTRCWLDRHEFTPRLTPPLALAAAWMVAFAPVWQREAAGIGGGGAAAALALAALRISPTTRDARTWCVLGALTGLVLAESHVGGLMLIAALAVRQVTALQLPSSRQLMGAAGTAAAVGALCLVPMALRPFANGAWLDLGFDPFSGELAAQNPVQGRAGPLQAWAEELGLVSAGLALGGALWALGQRRLRPLGAALLAFVLADALWPGAGGSVLSADVYAVVRLLALSSLALFSALAVHALALLLVSIRIPMARPAAVLVVVFYFTVGLATLERSSPRARPDLAAEVWTDEALATLPPGSLLLVRSPEVAWRLLSARVVRGERPDLVVVPVPLLARGSVAARLIQVEPGLGPLIREIAVNGRPGEYALSSLADKRPLYIELDREWDRNLLHHLRPQPMWLRFAPHALGRSDRAAGVLASRRSLRRVLEAATDSVYRDAATLEVLESRARQQAVVLAALGDRRSVSSVVRDLDAIDPEGRFLTELRTRLRERPRGRVDARDLLQ